MYDRVSVIIINSYYSKVPSSGTAVLLRSTVATTTNYLCSKKKLKWQLHPVPTVARIVVKP